MKMMVFALRNTKEILRDPINVAFGLGFPIVILLLLSAIQANIPVELFEIEKLTPGILVFGLAFISLFSSMIIAKDRSTSFLTRLCASPLSAKDFILGYTMPLLPIAIMQSIVCFIVAFILGLKVSINVLLALVVLIPADILFIAIGLLAGSIFNEKQVGGICGALLTNLTAWLSGTWFDLNLVGGLFKTVAYALPFVYSVNAARAALSGNYGEIGKNLIWVIIYAAVFVILAIAAFNRRIKSDKI